ncbi:MAG: hypothetical protein K2X38_16550 [Gemmataceae bacterium]|nr:hypothetical protein [Gemmataceae bacterium]
MRAGDGESRTELILSRSKYTGKALSLVCNREYLRRAAELGFRDIRMADASTPIVAHDRNRIYLFIPLTGSVPAPRGGGVTIDSVSVQVPQMRTAVSRLNSLPPSPEPSEQASVPASPEAPAPDSPLGMAMALRDHYRDGCRRASELVQAIRLQKRQTRLVESTLASLRELQVGR